MKTGKEHILPIILFLPPIIVGIYGGFRSVFGF